MSTYAIGDIQGCFNELQALLQHIGFDHERDTLWFAGDLVNRGPRSLDVLRFVKSLGERHVTVLGNHDLHLLALSFGTQTPQRDDTLTAILAAPDREALMTWLLHRPLLHYDQQKNYVMTHAGLAPAWSLQQARQLAQEVEAALRGPHVIAFFKQMYGNQPDSWDERLAGMERLRCITNYLTRLRFCYADGRMELAYKGEIADKPAGLLPWFDVTNRATADLNIIFGHWAALGGITNKPHVYALDTGCVWGNCLTAMRLEDEKRFSIPCQGSLSV